MKDPQVLHHYMTQSQADDGYTRARDAYFTAYKAKGGRKLGNISSSEDLEDATPPFWETYYTHHQKRFMTEDNKKIMLGMANFVKRKNNPDQPPTQPDRPHHHGRRIRPILGYIPGHKDYIPPENNYTPDVEPSGKDWRFQQEDVEFNATNALHYLGLSSLAYDIPPIYSDFNDVPPEYGLERYSVKEQIGQQRGSFISEARLPFQTTDHFGNTQYNAFGLAFFDREHHKVVFSIEGTDVPEFNLTNAYKFLQDVQTDLTATFAMYEGDNFHSGFLGMSLALLPDIKNFIQRFKNTAMGSNDLQIVFTGHSMGGAMAQLLAYLLSNEMNRNKFVCYTFASPRVFTDQFPGKIDNILRNNFRLWVKDDIVVYFPPRVNDTTLIEYEHMGRGFQLSFNGVMMETSGDTLTVDRKAPNGVIGFLANTFMGGVLGTPRVSVKAHGRPQIRSSLWLFIQQHRRSGESIQSVDKLLKKHRDRGVFTEDQLITFRDNRWVGENDKEMLPYFSHGTVGFQPGGYNPVLGVVDLNTIKFP